MSRFDAREFLNATRARGRRKIAQAICLLAAIAGGGVLWSVMSLSNSQNRSEELERNDRPEINSEVSSALRPTFTPDSSSARPQESGDGLSEHFGSWILRPSLEPEPKEVETAPGRQQLKGSTDKGIFTTRASCVRDQRPSGPIT